MAEGRGRVQFSAHALEVLSRCTWTGNVRELANLIERLSILCGGRVVESADLPPRYRPAAEADSGSPAGLGSLVRAEPVTEDCTSAAVMTPDPLNDHQVLQLLEGVCTTPGPMPELRATATEAASLPTEGIDLRAHLASIERALIEQALARTQGTVAHAARLLNLRRTTLVERLRKLGLLAAPGATEV